MSHFTIYKDVHGEYRWRFQASNNRILADSGEGYTSKADCEHGIELIKKGAADAPIKEA